MPMLLHYCEEFYTSFRHMVQVHVVWNIRISDEFVICWKIMNGCPQKMDALLYKMGIMFTCVVVITDACVLWVL